MSVQDNGATPPRPPACDLTQLESFPKEVKEHAQFVPWNYELRDGKWTKVLKWVAPNGKLCNAKSNDSTTWVAFEDAANDAREHNLDGVGFVLCEGDPFTVFDLDAKGTLTPDDQQRLTRVVEQLDSYSEVSPSGKGLHVWVRAKLAGPGMNQRFTGGSGGMEVYDRLRFITCTGYVHQGKPIAERQELVTAIEQQYRRLRPIVDSTDKGVQEIEDAQVLRKARDAYNADKFDALWHGDWVGLGYPSQSEADIALMNFLLFHGARGGEQCLRLFRMSTLGERSKAIDRDKYLLGTFRNARAMLAKKAAAAAQAQAHGAQVAAAWQQAPNPPAGAPQLAGPVPGQPGGSATAQAGTWVNGDFWPAPIALPPRTLVTRTADTVALEAMAWLWPGFLACKFLNLVVGETSAGKSTVLADIAARITTGRPWPGEPDGTAPRQRGRVLWLGSEDPMGLLTVPRLMACGADLHMVSEIQGVSRGGDARSSFSMQDDLAAVREELAQARAAGWPYAMLVIDPITSYLSGGKLRKVDMNDSGQLRTILEPWTVLADETGIAIVGVTHLAKDTTRSLLHRVLGGGAFAQLCRSLIAVVNRPDDGGPYAKAMLQVKSNLPDAQRGAWRFNTEQKVAGHTLHGQPVQANFPVWDYFDRALSPEELAGGTRGPVARKPSAFRLWLQAQFTGLQPDEWLAVEGVRAQAINEGVCSAKWWKEESGDHLEKRNLRGVWECRPKAGEQ